MRCSLTWFSHLQIAMDIEHDPRAISAGRAIRLQIIEPRIGTSFVQQGFDELCDVQAIKPRAIGRTGHEIIGQADHLRDFDSLHWFMACHGSDLLMCGSEELRCLRLAHESQSGNGCLVLHAAWRGIVCELCRDPTVHQLARCFGTPAPYVSRQVAASAPLVYSFRPACCTWPFSSRYIAAAKRE